MSETKHTDTDTEEFEIEIAMTTFDRDHAGGEAARDVRTFDAEDLTPMQVAKAYTEFHTTTVEAEDHTHALNLIWRQWNRGSGHESPDFAEAETRSLTKGDLVTVEDSTYFIESIGWTEIDIEAN